MARHGTVSAVGAVGAVYGWQHSQRGRHDSAPRAAHASLRHCSTRRHTWPAWQCVRGSARQPIALCSMHHAAPHCGCALALAAVALYLVQRDGERGHLPAHDDVDNPCNAMSTAAISITIATTFAPLHVPQAHTGA